MQRARSVETCGSESGYSGNCSYVRGLSVGTESRGNVSVSSVEPLPTRVTRMLQAEEKRRLTFIESPGSEEAEGAL